VPIRGAPASVIPDHFAREDVEEETLSYYEDMLYADPAEFEAMFESDGAAVDARMAASHVGVGREEGGEEGEEEETEDGFVALLSDASDEYVELEYRAEVNDEEAMDAEHTTDVTDSIDVSLTEEDLRVPLEDHPVVGNLVSLMNPKLMRRAKTGTPTAFPEEYSEFREMDEFVGQRERVVGDASEQEALQELGELVQMRDVIYMLSQKPPAMPSLPGPGDASWDPVSAAATAEAYRQMQHDSPRSRRVPHEEVLDPAMRAHSFETMYRAQVARALQAAAQEDAQGEAAVAAEMASVQSMLDEVRGEQAGEQPEASAGVEAAEEDPALRGQLRLLTRAPEGSPEWELQEIARGAEKDVDDGRALRLAAHLDGLAQAYGQPAGSLAPSLEELAQLIKRVARIDEAHRALQEMRAERARAQGVMGEDEPVEAGVAGGAEEGAAGSGGSATTRPARDAADAAASAAGGDLDAKFDRILQRMERGKGAADRGEDEGEEYEYEYEYEEVDEYGGEGYEGEEAEDGVHDKERFGPRWVSEDEEEEKRESMGTRLLRRLSERQSINDRMPPVTSRPDDITGHFLGLLRDLRDMDDDEIRNILHVPALREDAFFGGVNTNVPVRTDESVDSMRFAEQREKLLRTLDVTRWPMSPRYRKVDKAGRAFGVGRRKRSHAAVYLSPGSGDIRVNGKSLIEYFSMYYIRHDVVMPLAATNTCGVFDIHAHVRGGGITGQAGALRLGIARALQEFDPRLRPALKQAGLLTRDRRVVEPKKPGKKKARKSKQWVKR